ncbi:MAG: hypothetical protein COV67_03695 [Nitrospinae bacterium CG11_big_fil_rev_8_21_14_0_20_56_8]|nr:MAG: hypothetical protein COV67_03695 [Nitrospinae bacterium CG11_big_fil_rev_8_21_14_0_20_56_8]
MIEKIAFITYPVSRLAPAIDFYQNVLGFKLLFQEGSWAEFVVGGIRFALQEQTEPVDPMQRGMVFWEARPIETVMKQLEANGVRWAGPLEVHPFGKLIRFADPDGNLLGLYEPPA